MEGRVHRRLKVLAAAYLRAEGFPVVGMEVAGPIGRHRVDVAAWSDRHAPDREPLTVVVECKASRTDFIRDRRNAGRLRREREDLERRLRELEHGRIMRREPELRTGGGGGLFAEVMPELGEWNFAASRDAEYRACLRRLRSLDAMLHGETKFFVFEKYRLADRLFVAAPAGTLRLRDLPPGWGLLEASPAALAGDEPPAGPDLFGDGPLSVRVRAPARRRAAGRFRERLLRNLAVANTRDALRPHGVAGGGGRGLRGGAGAAGSEAAWDPDPRPWLVPEVNGGAARGASSRQWAGTRARGPADAGRRQEAGERARRDSNPGVLCRTDTTDTGHESDHAPPLLPGCLHRGGGALTGG